MVMNILNKMLAWSTIKPNCPHLHHLKPLCVEFEYLILTSPSGNITVADRNAQSPPNYPWIQYGNSEKSATYCLHNFHQDCLIFQQTKAYNHILSTHNDYKTRNCFEQRGATFSVCNGQPTGGRVQPKHQTNESSFIT